ncbi:MAG: DoxX family protein [Nitrococcus mobilis]|nr:DoxX family protein [Nitrococcus mobilis]
MTKFLSKDWWLSPGSSGWAILARLSLAGVFVFEGIQKLIFPEILGTGRFIKIGIPAPEIMGPFVGSVELICGALILIGLFSRLAAVPLIIVMIVAIVSTKIPILLGSEWLIFNLRDLSRYGFWSFTHETRTDWAMLLGALYILLAGGGRWSLDQTLFGRQLEVGHKSHSKGQSAGAIS